MSHLPRQVTVDRLLSSRYADNKRPLSWDERVEGVDKFITTEGEEVSVFSDGGQSPPNPGWQVLLTDFDKASGATRWTLYGIPHTT